MGDVREGSILVGDSLGGVLTSRNAHVGSLHMRPPTFFIIEALCMVDAVCRFGSSDRYPIWVE